MDSPLRDMTDKICAKCDKPAVAINGATIPVCSEHDEENSPSAKFVEAIKSIGYPV